MQQKFNLKNSFCTAYDYLSNSFKIEVDDDKNKILDLHLVDSPYLFLNLVHLIPKLCIKAVMPRLHYNGLESQNVIVIDGGINHIDFYNIVQQSQFYGFEPNVVLDRIIISRTFTINQLANTIIYELPKMIQKYKSKLVIITDLHNGDLKTMNADKNWLLGQMIDVIKNIARTSFVCVFSSVIIKQFKQVIRKNNFKDDEKNGKNNSII